MRTLRAAWKAVGEWAAGVLIYVALIAGAWWDVDLEDEAEGGEQAPCTPTR